MEFVEAVESLAASAGLEVPCEEKISSEKTASTNALYTITEKAAQFYEQQLKKSSAAIEYLKKRGLSGQIAKYFRLGFSVNEWDALYKTLSSQNKEVLKDSGLFIDNNGRFYDRFRNRVMFPIRDIRGRVIAFGGRTFTDEQPKYLNSPETPIFHKSFELYGLYEAKQKNKTLVRALMVEGYMDVISLAEQGITYAAATLGTAINIKHVQKLLRYTHEIIFCFDGDQAGQNAAKKALEITLPLIRDDIKIRFMFLPEEDDPDSLIQKIGKQAFEKLMDESQTISDFFFDQLKKEIPIRSLDDKARFAERALKQLEKVPQGIFKNLMEQQLANLLSVEPEQLKRLVFSAETKKHPVNISLQRMHPADLIMALLLNRPALIELIQDTQSWQFFKFEHKDFFDLLIMTLKQHPHIKAGDLLTKMDPQYHPLIAKLAAW
ncbi:MAG: DNA primase, partial [Gammaproteobacteria bacterium RIFOXYB2_FULL_38_6]